MILGDQYKLSFCYSVDGISFLIESPFIPLLDVFVPGEQLATTHNGKYIKAQDLRKLLLNSNALNIPLANLMHFDLSDFVLQAGIYNPNTGYYRLSDSRYLDNGMAAPPSPYGREDLPPAPPSRQVEPQVEIQNFYVLLYLQVN